MEEGFLIGAAAMLLSWTLKEVGYGAVNKIEIHEDFVVMRIFGFYRRKLCALSEIRLIQSVGILEVGEFEAQPGDRHYITQKDGVIFVITKNDGARIFATPADSEAFTEALREFRRAKAS